MKKKVLSAILILVLLLAAALSAYAEESIQPRDTNKVTYVTNRTSRTTADVDISVTFTEVVDRYSVVVYLQKKVDGEWVLDTTNEDYVFYNNGFNKETFLFSHEYTHLVSGVNYQIRCVSKDYIGDSTFILTTYSNPF